MNMPNFLQAVFTSSKHGSEEGQANVLLSLPNVTINTLNIASVVKAAISYSGWHFDWVTNWTGCMYLILFQHQSKVSASLASGDLLTSSACIGADTLLKLLGNYCRNKDIKTAITVGVVGML